MLVGIEVNFGKGAGELVVNSEVRLKYDLLMYSLVLFCLGRVMVMFVFIYLGYY